MNHINKLFISGTIAKPVEVKKGQSGSEYGIVTLESRSSYKKNGEEKTEITEVQFCVFGAAVARAQQTLVPGTEVMVEGKLKSSRTSGREGNTYLNLNVNMLSMHVAGRGAAPRSQTQTAHHTPPAQPTAPAPAPSEDDDIPF